VKGQPLRPNTTQTPDLILDNLPAFTDPELRVALVIIRSTLGWGKAQDWLTSSQIVKRTGRSRASVSAAIGSLVDRGFIVVMDEDGRLLDTAAKRKFAGERHQRLYYALNTDTPVKNLDRACPESRQGPVQDLDTTRNTPNKKHRLQDCMSDGTAVERLNSRKDKLMAYLNKATGRSGATLFRAHCGLRARLNDGATDEDVCVVIDLKVAEWAGVPKMAKHICPQTLFSPKNFPRYLVEAREWDAKGRPSFNGDRPQIARGRQDEEYEHLVRRAP